jgi:methyl-accepting chemotaxis protein
MFKNLSIAKRLAGGTAVKLSSMVILTAVGMLQVNKINHSLTLINDVNGVKERYAINFRGSVHDRAIAVRDLTLVPPAELPAVVAHIEQLEEAYRKSAAPMDAIFAAGTDVSEAERAHLEKIKEVESRTTPLVHDVIAKVQAGSSAAAKKEVLDKARPAFVEWLAAINGMIDMEEKMNNTQAALARGIGVNFQYLMLALSLVGIAMGITVATMVAMSLKRALGCEPADLQRIADEIGAGDLSVDLGIRSKDTNSSLASLSRMQATLRSIMREVGEAATNVNASSQQMASASDSIASGAQEQAASLEETSASLEEITAAVRQSADNAQQANQLATGSKDSALQGQEVVSKAITAMAEINAASAKIYDIISTIDEIAFQTNLLAVNAAVEAARAGDEGRGFAVVAAEVRSLAQRSAVAAKEIKVLIQDSLKKVEVGSALVSNSGETLQGIVGSVKRVTDIVGEMAASSGEQSTGIEQVGTAMMQMDQVTQANSAQTEELSATAHAVSGQAAHLMRLIGTFKLNDNGGSQRERQGFEPDVAVTVKPALKPGTKQRLKSVVQPLAKTVRAGMMAKPSSSTRSGNRIKDLEPILANAVPTSDASFEEF